MTRVRQPGIIDRAKRQSLAAGSKHCAGNLNGTVPDPIDGAPYFFTKPNYNGTPQDAPGKSYKRMLGDDLIAPVYPPRITGTANYFFNRNPYPPK